MLGIVIAGGMIICAIQAIRSAHLLNSAIWLAGCSALIALLIYMLGAPQIAVIELSVGAGLVTVLFVFAINITGEDASTILPSIPRPVAWIMVVLSVAVFAWMVLPNLGMPFISVNDLPLMDYLWSTRGVDLMLQVVLIFAGVLGMLSLLSGSDRHAHLIEEESK